MITLFGSTLTTHRQIQTTPTPRLDKPMDIPTPPDKRTVLEIAAAIGKIDTSGWMPHDSSGTDVTRLHPPHAYEHESWDTPDKDTPPLTLLANNFENSGFR